MPAPHKAFATAAVAACFALAACDPNDAGPTAATTTEQVATTPANVGDCVQALVVSVGPRLEGVPDSGSAISYDNQLSQVSYDAIPGIDHSQAGDQVRLCLVSIPENCPPGDDRGRVYTATNGRTGETWTAPDSQHMCGGA